MKCLYSLALADLSRIMRPWYNHTKGFGLRRKDTPLFSELRNAQKAQNRAGRANTLPT